MFCFHDNIRDHFIFLYVQVLYFIICAERSADLSLVSIG